MKETHGDLWSFLDPSTWTYVAIPTNGVVKANGEAVMGKGVALQAATRFSTLAFRLGAFIRDYGNQVYYFEDLSLFTFPTKHHWRNPSDLALIKLSAYQLSDSDELCTFDTIYLPEVGCGKSTDQLSWEKEVGPLLSTILDDRFIIVHPR